MKARWSGLVWWCVGFNALMAFAVVDEAVPDKVTRGAVDKIDGEILAHRAVKVRPPSVPPARHAAKLRNLGLNAANLTAEDCALYVRERLSPEEIEVLASQGIAVNPRAWVPPVAGKHAFGFHLGTVDYSSLDQIRDDPRVVRLASTEHGHRPKNDLAGVMIHADDVHAGNGVTARDGTGVRVAVADSGVDLTHPDLPAPVEAFDMTDGVGPGTWGTDVSNTVTDHGTHVCGSVVGDGLLSGGQYTGSAPGADFYFYKIGNDSSGSASSDDIIEAINRARSVGCDVFTMSYGGYSTWMDGTSAVCQAIDSAVAAGMTVFVSAGNEADDDQHYSRSVAPLATSPQFTFTIDNTQGTTAYTEEVWIRMTWLDDNSADLNMNLLTLPGAGESWIMPFEGTSARGTEGKRYVLTPNVPAGGSKTYSFTMTNSATTGSTPLVHLYRVSGRGTFDSPVASYTVTHPALADEAIAVGAWVQRKDWIDSCGSSAAYPGWTVDSLAPFSGLGPRVDGSLKPDIVAPGAATISSRDSTPGPADTVSRIIDNDGLALDCSGPAEYYVKQGTSMACPMAAGAAALLIEAHPTWTPSQVRAALTSTASMAGAPDSQAGYGLIDVLAAVNFGSNGCSLIRNGDFEGACIQDPDGDSVPEGWGKSGSPGPDPPTMGCIADNGPSSAGLQAVGWSRTTSSQQGRHMNIQQPLSIDASQYSSLELLLDVKVLSHDLEAGGWVSPAFEWPVVVGIDYTLASNPAQLQQWKHGFYVAPPGDGSRTDDPGWGIVPVFNDTQVTAGAWDAHTFDLFAELPDLGVITRVIVGGAGWSYEGRADNISIIGIGGADCNSNGVSDGCDVGAGTSLDCNGNGVPDECDACACSDGDGNADGTVDSLDYALFGSCYAGPGVPADPGCEAMDMDGNCTVDLTDFAAFQRVFTGP